MWLLVEYELKAYDNICILFSPHTLPHYASSKSFQAFISLSIVLFENPSFLPHIKDTHNCELDKERENVMTFVINVLEICICTSVESHFSKFLCIEFNVSYVIFMKKLCFTKIDDNVYLLCVCLL